MTNPKPSPRPGPRPKQRAPWVRRFPAPLIALSAALLGNTITTAQEPVRPDHRVKRLIEFGWDEPDTAFLRRHIANMETTPFDGCVFHVLTRAPQGRQENFTWLAWGKRSFAAPELASARADLEATAWRRFTHNFLRFNTTPADLDWFDDHSAVLNNARRAAELARAGRCAGILLDVEEYQGRLFTYARQRDANRRTWDAYAAQARLRGRAVMDAFQQGFPGLTVFLTFGPSLPRLKSQEGKKPLAECESGLLAPFLDGMIEAAPGSTRLIDGFELSYGYKDEVRFDAGYRLMKQGVLPLVADPAAHQRVVLAGFGLWMDYDWPKYGWDPRDPSRNYFTPETFGTSLRWALDRSDQYVWIYTETPRWWSDAGGPVKLPEAYNRAIREAMKR